MIPRFSVVIPVSRDGGKWLPSALESALSDIGSRSEFEIVVVADGWDPREITYRWRGSLVRFLALNRVGLVAALNTGIDASRGHYIVRLDSDDLWARGRAADLQRIVCRSRSVDAVAGSILRWGACRSRYEAAPSSKSDLRERLFHRGYAVAHPAVCLRKASVVEVGGYREIPGAEDLDLWLRLLDARWDFSRRPHTLYRVHTGQTTAQRDASSSVENLLEKFPEAGLPCSPSCPGRLSSLRARREQRWADTCPRYDRLGYEEVGSVGRWIALGGARNATKTGLELMFGKLLAHWTAM